MAGRAASARKLGLRVALAGVIALLTMLAVAQVASGRAGSSCDAAANSAEFTFDPHPALHVSASYNEDFMGGDKVAASYKGATTYGASSCTDADPFSNIGIELGDGDDRARLDGKKPSFDSQATDPVPAFVAVIIDGNGGADVLRGHKGQDTMYGRKGNDVIRIKGGGADTADCGQGRDKVILSGPDQAIDCELSVSP